MESKNMIGFDLKPALSNIGDQTIILLSIVGIVMIVAAFATQGFGRAILGFLGVLVIIVAILLLLNAKAIGTELKDLIFKPAGGVILPWNITTRESLSNLLRFTR